MNEDSLEQHARDNGLNPSLAISQGLQWSDVSLIAQLHKYKDTIFAEAYACDPITERGKLRILSEELATTEFCMQAAWKFEQSIAHHTYWYKMPHCTCPEMDNKERFGVNQKILTMGCPVHGYDKETDG